MNGEEAQCSLSIDLSCRLLLHSRPSIPTPVGLPYLAYLRYKRFIHAATRTLLSLFPHIVPIKNLDRENLRLSEAEAGFGGDAPVAF